MITDSQQQPNACTSRGGGEPGPDGSLARGRTTSSALLRLHRDEVCLESQGLGLKTSTVTADCKRASIQELVEKTVGRERQRPYLHVKNV